ncbi:hypothetical protein NA56DRAFT_710747 [Hyaloscypha hepaticicola]|uniref:2EXR domain-containing protein n=1 Tax=Hyaloscypha hepaticicola TaxID=2082293 RepID=A0A2J6PLD2_9HELO|nr:hypothetical protein NA56DRAFT_710747 [Hyaloscypha hepaticicola]
MDFTLFPNLALELQDMIWAFALPPPRIITIRIYDKDWYDDGDLPYKFEADAGPGLIATELLQTCSRSPVHCPSPIRACFPLKTGRADILQLGGRHSTFYQFCYCSRVSYDFAEGSSQDLFRVPNKASALQNKHLVNLGQNCSNS